MLTFKKWLVATILADTTMQGLIKNNAPSPTVPYSIYPLGTDIQPEAFPAITYQDAGISLLPVPTGMHVGRIQLDVWSILNTDQIETIYTRLAQLFNYQHQSVSPSPMTNGILWFMFEENVKDSIEMKDRRIWRKTIDYKFWASNTDQT